MRPHNLCHAPGCSARAVRGWTRCARHFSGAIRRTETDTALSRLTAAQRRIHADVQLHGVRIYGVRRLPAIERLAAVGLVEYEYAPLRDVTITVRLPASESARLKGPWRRDEIRAQAGDSV